MATVTASDYPSPSFSRGGLGIPGVLPAGAQGVLRVALELSCQDDPRSKIACKKKLQPKGTSSQDFWPTSLGGQLRS